MPDVLLDWLNLVVNVLTLVVFVRATTVVVHFTDEAKRYRGAIEKWERTYGTPAPSTWPPAPTPGRRSYP